MANKELAPLKDYTIKAVGPHKDWSFESNGKTVNMRTFSVQFEGLEQYWIDYNVKPEGDASEQGKTLAGKTVAGHIEQDQEGKYAPKFKKESSGGGFGGGGKASPGAIWSSAVDISANIVAAYCQLSGKHPKTIDEFLQRVEQVAPRVNAMVDKLAGAAKPAPDTKTESESGVTPGAAPTAPAAAATPPKADLVIEDISDEDLGSW